MKDGRELIWSTGWSLDMFAEVEEYGVLFLFPAQDRSRREWLIYDRASSMVVAITPGIQELGLLNKQVTCESFPEQLAKADFGFRIAA